MEYEMRRGVSVKTFVVPVLFFAALTAPGFSYTVLWDASNGVADNGGYQPSGHYAALTQHLGNNDFTVNTTTLGFTENYLANTDVAVVCITSAYNSAYSDAEATLLADFVNEGGGLLIMGTHPYLNLGSGNSNIQPVADKFGITLATSGTIYTGTYTLALEHPVFAGFTENDRISMPAAGEIAIDEDDLDLALAQGSSTERIFIAGVNYGAGRVIALGDFNIFSQEGNIFNQYNNSEFALNTFQWLAVPEPATILLMAAGAALLRRRR
jgi:hypothetical protein